MRREEWDERIWLDAKERHMHDRRKFHASLLAIAILGVAATMVALILSGCA